MPTYRGGPPGSVIREENMSCPRAIMCEACGIDLKAIVDCAPGFGRLSATEITNIWPEIAKQIKLHEMTCQGAAKAVLAS
jgi:hypothetical protein